jgi:hypothetical protein
LKYAKIVFTTHNLCRRSGRRKPIILSSVVIKNFKIIFCNFLLDLARTRPVVYECAKELKIYCFTGLKFAAKGRRVTRTVICKSYLRANLSYWYIFSALSRLFSLKKIPLHPYLEFLGSFLGLRPLSKKVFRIGENILPAKKL